MSAIGQDVSGDIQLLSAENSLRTVTAEYFWSAGKFSGMGYHDQYDNGSIDYFADHVIEYNVNSMLYGAVEFGFTSFGNNKKYGVGTRAGSLPGLIKVFTYFNVTYFAHVTGANSEQVKVAWGTKSLKLTNSLDMYFEGFTRLRDGLPDLWQPQVWFRHRDVPFDFGTEVEVYGGETNISLAIKFLF